jgi:kumamolisin
MIMTSPGDSVALPGSESSHPPDAHVVGPVDPEEPMTVTVTLRPRSPGVADAELESMSLRPVSERTYVSREAFGAAHGANPAALKTVEDFAQGYNLKVAEADAARRSVILTGRAADFATAFGVKLDRFQHSGGSYRSISSPVHVPAALAPLVESVLGLDDRPVARPRS